MNVSKNNESLTSSRNWKIYTYLRCIGPSAYNSIPIAGPYEISLRSPVNNWDIPSPSRSSIVESLSTIPTIELRRLSTAWIPLQVLPSSHGLSLPINWHQITLPLKHLQDISLLIEHDTISCSTLAHCSPAISPTQKTENLLCFPIPAKPLQRARS